MHGLLNIKTRYRNSKIFLDLYMLLIIGVAAFFITTIIAPLHIAGDQVHYTKAFDSVRFRNFSEALVSYRKVIFSDELGHFFVIWVASQLGFQKLVLMSFLNSILASLNYLWLRERGFTRSFSLLLTVTNYYLYTMFFTLEKLKLAAIFMLFFLVLSHRSTVKIVALIASGISHFQTAFITGIVYCSHLASGRVNFFSRHLLIFLALFVSLWLTQPIQFLYDKLYFYAKTNFLNQSVTQITAQIALFPFFVYCSRNRKEAMTFLLLLMSFITVLGGDRLNMYFYFGFIYYCRERSMFTKSFLLTNSIYFTYKVTNYITMIYLTGG